MALRLQVSEREALPLPDFASSVETDAEAPAFVHLETCLGPLPETFSGLLLQADPLGGLLFPFLGQLLFREVKSSRWLVAELCLMHFLLRL